VLLPLPLLLLQQLGLGLPFIQHVPWSSSMHPRS
jgi:hypothetical protein